MAASASNLTTQGDEYGKITRSEAERRDRCAAKSAGVDNVDKRAMMQRVESGFLKAAARTSQRQRKYRSGKQVNNAFVARASCMKQFRSENAWLLVESEFLDAMTPDGLNCSLFKHSYFFPCYSYVGVTCDTSSYHYFACFTCLCSQSHAN